MGSEILIYGYGLVCLSMLAFNLFYSIYLRMDERRERRWGRRVKAVAVPSLARIREGGSLTEETLRRTERLLGRVNHLLAFDNFLQTLDGASASAYLRQLSPLFPPLADRYLRREELQGTYFCHFIAAWGGELENARQALALKMVPYIQRKSFYSRINALKALCTLGEAEILMDAVPLLEGGRGGSGLHGKILVEALMTYRGNAGELIALIWQRLPRFSTELQRGLLDYIRFRSGAYQDQMLAVLLDESMDKELRFSAIRYFGRYPDQRARQTLLGFVSDPEPTRWEYAAISASCLAQYPGADTVETLSGAMHSPNWYVRCNSAESLEKLGLTYEDLLGDAAGKDRYAREMLTYRLETKQLREQTGEEVAVV